MNEEISAANEKDVERKSEKASAGNDYERAYKEMCEKFYLLTNRNRHLEKALLHMADAMKYENEMTDPSWRYF